MLGSTCFRCWAFFQQLRFRRISIYSCPWKNSDKNCSINALTAAVLINVPKIKTTRSVLFRNGSLKKLGISGKDILKNQGVP